MNKIIILEIYVNHWKNTNSVMSWFRQLQNKNRLSFVNFDVERFYPSISENLFQEGTNFAKDKIDISDTELSIVLQARHFFPTLIYYGLNFQEMTNSMYQWVLTMIQRSAKYYGLFFRINQATDKNFVGLDGDLGD